MDENTIMTPHVFNENIKLTEIVVPKKPANHIRVRYEVNSIQHVKNRTELHKMAKLIGADWPEWEGHCA